MIKKQKKLIQNSAKKIPHFGRNSRAVAKSFKKKPAQERKSVKWKILQRIRNIMREIWKMGQKGKGEKKWEAS